MQQISLLTQALIKHRKSFHEEERRVLRPSSFEGQNIHFDPDLSTDIVLYLEEYLKHLSDDQQASLKRLCLGLKSFDYSTAPEALEFFKFDSSLQSRIKKTCDKNSGLKPWDCIHPAIGAGLFVWSLNQPWAKEIKIATVFSKWAHPCIEKQKINGSFMNNSLFLAQLLPLVPYIPEKSRSTFMNSAVSTLLSYKCPWSSHHNRHELTAHYLVLLGKAALFCRNGFGKEGHPIPYCWSNGASEALAGHWEHFADPALFKQLSKEAALTVTALIESNLPKEDLRRVFMKTKSDVWCIPAVHSLLKEHLHVEESRRLFELPWCNVPNSYEINRATARLYCPVLFQTMELSTTAEQWQERKVIAKLMRRWTKPSVSMALPEGMSLE